MNFHLKQAGQSEIATLGKDLADSKACLHVMNQLDSNCSLAALSEPDDTKRGELMLLESQKLGVADVIGHNDIVKGNSKVNIIFVAELFNTKHGLQELTKVE